MVLVLVAFAAAACARSANPVTKNTPSPSPTKLTWTDCGGGFQCSTVQAPLDYAHPAAGTIGIAISRKPATDTAHRIGSVLTNPGGPGASVIQSLRAEVCPMTNRITKFHTHRVDPPVNRHPSP